MPKGSDVHYDATFGDAELALARRALAAGDPGPASSVLTTRPTSTVPFALLALTDPTDLEPTHGGVDGVPWAGASRAMHHWWQVTLLEREDVGALAPAAYRHAVEGAHALATMRGPELPPWFSTIALAVETDLGHGVEQRKARFEGIVARYPEDALAWFVHLRSLRYEDAIERIDRAALASRPGSILHALRVVPRIERWRQSEPAARAAFFSSPEVASAVTDASARFLEGESHPPYALFAHALLAFAVFRVPDASAARTHLDAMAGRWTFWPWGFLRRPADALVEVMGQHRKMRSFRLR